MPCTQCGAATNADDPFCPKCGARRASALPVPADPLRTALERALGAQYEIQRLLGRGGMGAVYLAHEKALERAVAIKVLPPETATDADTRERFRREARTAAKLTHPNIVPLHTFGDVDGMQFFVMGYVKGESLAGRMRREGRLPEEDVRRILAEVADALHYAHKQGVVHRDIKPDNILLDDESGRPMLTDFGVAKAKASGATLTEAGAVVGTPYYMSPEQASGSREIDGRSDLYSLGVMGYAMLSGRLPFEGESFQDIIVQHVTQEPPPLAALVPEVPADLTAAVMRCLAKEPGKRWPDAQQLRAALSVMDSEDGLPDYAARLHGTGFRCAAGLWAFGLAGLVSYLFPGAIFDRSNWWLAPVGLFSVGAFVANRLQEARLRGLPWSGIRRLVLSPPRWWPFWWPRRWRHSGDVWDRLPGVLRWARHVVGFSIAWSTTVLPTWTIAVVAGIVRPHGDWELLLLFGPSALMGLAPFLPILVGVLTGLRDHTLRIQRVGAGLRLDIGGRSAWAMGGTDVALDDHDYGRLIFAPTSRLSFWRDPKFAALLLPQPGHAALARPAEPRAPEELAQAIRDLVGQLPSGTQATVSEAADAARQLLGTVAALDAELAKLAQDADPQELEAVEAKLRALGTEAPDEGDVRRQKRAALMPQLQLLRELDQRLREATQRRAHLLDLLRTMWLQLANLRAEAAHDTLAVTEVSGRIRALCTEIDAHAEAAQTVRAVTR